MRSEGDVLCLVCVWSDVSRTGAADGDGEAETRAGGEASGGVESSERSDHERDGEY